MLLKPNNLFFKRPTTTQQSRTKYDYNSNPTWRYDAKMNAAKWSQSYTYDGLNRLTKAEQGEFNGTWPGSPSLSTTDKKTWDWAVGQDRSLDRLGNWKNFSNDGTVTADTISPANEIATHTVGGTGYTFTHDANGNLTDTDAGQTPAGPGADRRRYTYDYRNRLIKVENRTGDPEAWTALAEYRYDGLNRRVVKDLPSGTDVRYLYNGWRSIQEVSVSSPATVMARYVYGLTYLDEVIRMDREHEATPDGDIYEQGSFGYYFMQDLMYSTVALVDDSGAVAERYWYEPYGKATFADSSGAVLTPQATACGNEHLFTGQRYCAETRSSGNFGLYYYKNRYYDAGLGRFATRDLFGVPGTNLLEMCDSHPLICGDPLGWVHVYMEGLDEHPERDRRRFRELKQLEARLTGIAKRSPASFAAGPDGYKYCCACVIDVQVKHNDQKAFAAQYAAAMADPSNDTPMKIRDAVRGLAGGADKVKAVAHFSPQGTQDISDDVVFENPYEGPCADILNRITIAHELQHRAAFYDGVPGLVPGDNEGAKYAKDEIASNNVGAAAAQEFLDACSTRYKVTAESQIESIACGSHMSLARLYSESGLLP